MKKKISMRTLSALFALFSMGILVSSCNKLDDDGQEQVVAGLMGFNLSTDQPAVTLAINGSSLYNIPLGFSNYTGNYVAVYTGNRQIQAYGSGTTPLTTTDVLLDSNKYYSVFFIGANNNYQALTVNDNFEGLTGATGKAYVRYINAIPDSAQPNLVYSLSGSEILNEPTRYKQVSSFMEVDPGELSIELSDGASIDTSRSFTLQPKRLYTVLLVGDPESQDPTKVEQIKYIENGTLPD